MASKKNNSIAWGVTLLFFGCLFLSRTLNLLPPNITEYVYDIKNYPLIIGLIFLVTHSNKNIGIALLIVGLFVRISDIIHWTRHLSSFIWPSLLIIAGILLIYKKK